MNYPKLFAYYWVAVFFFMEKGLGNYLGFETPPLALLAVVLFSVYHGPSFGFGLGLWGGFLADVLAPGRLGSQAAFFAATGLACGFSAGFFFRESFLTCLVLPLTAVFLKRLYDCALYKSSQGGGFFQTLSEGFWDWRGVLWVVSCSVGIHFFLKKSSLLKPRDARRPYFHNY